MPPPSVARPRGDPLDPAQKARDREPSWRANRIVERDGDRLFDRATGASRLPEPKREVEGELR
ncbi:MAG TPA: hypothetical protein VK116_16210, partial [Planctomycetota bacterium]|nr:hypothetical protein [Planctomycetota bacterium]